jgi:hypothetical protein
MSTKFWKIEVLGVLPLRPSAITQAFIDRLRLHSYPDVSDILCGPGPFQAPRATCTIHNSSSGILQLHRACHQFFLWPPPVQDTTTCLLYHWKGSDKGVHLHLILQDKQSVHSTIIHRNPQESTGIHKIHRSQAHC